jgi:UrcA family protein
MNTETFNQVRTAIAAVLFGALATVAALPASANGYDSPPQITIKFGDLDISKPQGAAALYARIRAAAKVVCPRIEERNLGEKVRNDACVDHAILIAVTQVDAPALTALYSKSTGKEVPVRLAAR